MNEGGSVFPVPELPPALVADLRRQNPWWSGDPAPVQPGPRRHLVGQIRGRLNLELAPIVAVRGPRQVGKTTAQLQIIEDLLTEGAPPSTVLRVQFDDVGSLHDLVDPILRIADWFEHHVAGAH
ncbi:MAG: AAA family ATPase, partial [Acidobacteria bacterium]|nr:AAA family ATPase [Acidobacteriota bacterium]